MKKLLSLIALVLMFSCCGKDPGKMPWEDDLNGKDNTSGGKAGETLSAWSEGYLDIHFISTNRGECAFYILPDGTTMLVDAGEIHSADADIPQRPDGDSRVYETYAKYIKHFLPSNSDGKLDYALVTHFHIDHMGDMDSSNPKHPEGAYQLCGFSGLYEDVPFRKIVDRGYPSYANDESILSPLKESSSTKNYINFVNYAVKNKGLVAERFEVGTDKQFVLTGANKGNYPDFRIFNHVGNGNCYQKNDAGVGHVSESSPGSENGTCCGIHIHYGKFDMVAAGDLVSSAQNMQALYCRDFIEKLEVFKCNHHMNTNSWGTNMQKSYFTPRVVIVPAFANKHADSGILTNIFEQVWTKDVYLTKNWDSAMEAHKDLYLNCAGYDGHVVVRVDPGGDQFRVYMLDNTDYSYKIKSEPKVYTCK